MGDGQFGHPGGIRHQVVGQAGILGLAVSVVRRLLEQRRSDPLGHSPGDLAVDDHGRKQRSAVMGHHVVQNLRRTRGRIDGDSGHMHPSSKGDGGRLEADRLVQAGVAAVGKHTSGGETCGHFGQPHAPSGRSHHLYRAVSDAQVGGSQFPLLRHRVHNPVAQHVGRFVDRTACYHRAAAGQRAPTMLYRSGVTPDHRHLLGIDAQRLRAHFGEHSLMSLTLRTRAGGHFNPAGLVHPHTGALEGSDTGALHIGGHTDAD